MSFKLVNASLSNSIGCCLDAENGLDSAGNPRYVVYPTVHLTLANIEQGRKLREKRFGCTDEARQYLLRLVSNGHMTVDNWHNACVVLNDFDDVQISINDEYSCDFLYPGKTGAKSKHSDYIFIRDRTVD